MSPITWSDDIWMLLCLLLGHILHVNGLPCSDNHIFSNTRHHWLEYHNYLPLAGKCPFEYLARHTFSIGCIHLTPSRA